MRQAPGDESLLCIPLELEEFPLERRLNDELHGTETDDDHSGVFGTIVHAMIKDAE